MPAGRGGSSRGRPRAVLKIVNRDATIQWFKFLNDAQLEQVWRYANFVMRRDEKLRRLKKRKQAQTYAET